MKDDFIAIATYFILYETSNWYKWKKCHNINYMDTKSLDITAIISPFRKGLIKCNIISHHIPRLLKIPSHLDSLWGSMAVKTFNLVLHVLWCH